MSTNDQMIQSNVVPYYIRSKVPCKNLALGVNPKQSAREKILMGFNFYGRHIKDAQAQKLDHILGRDYINILKELERKRLYKNHITYMI